ncbi:MAG: hypothetical protein Fur0022_21550 [Anaerolineales bacterium]
MRLQTNEISDIDQLPRKLQQELKPVFSGDEKWIVGFITKMSLGIIDLKPVFAAFIVTNRRLVRAGFQRGSKSVKSTIDLKFIQEIRERKKIRGQYLVEIPGSQSEYAMTFYFEKWELRNLQML